MPDRVIRLIASLHGNRVIRGRRIDADTWQVVGLDPRKARSATQPSGGQR